MFNFSLVSSLCAIIVALPHASTTQAHTKPSRNAQNATLTATKLMGQHHRQFTNIFLLFPVFVQCLQVLPMQQKCSTGPNMKLTQRK